MLACTGCGTGWGFGAPALLFTWLMPIFVAGLVGISFYIAYVCPDRPATDKENRKWRRSEAQLGHCPKCGYDLRATPEYCPECGHRPIRIQPKFAWTVGFRAGERTLTVSVPTAQVHLIQNLSAPDVDLLLGVRLSQAPILITGSELSQICTKVLQLLGDADAGLFRDIRRLRQFARVYSYRKMERIVGARHVPIPAPQAVHASCETAS